MSAGQQGPQAQQSGSGDPGRDAVQRAANGEELKPGEEKSALDWLLGAPAPANYYVDVEYDTPEGLKPLRVNFGALDGSVLDKIEQSHISERTGTMDKAAADAELFVTAAKSLEVVETGQTFDVKAKEFRVLKEGDEPLASPADALNARLRKQPGLIAGVARAIREAAGWNPDRVGQASRVLVDAAGN